MGSLNKVILIGNLGADPEIKTMPDGTKLAKFSIATTERYKNREGEQISNTEWHNIVLWRRTAEIAEKYLKKGDSICVEGKLKTRSWEDEHGTKKYATDIQGDTMTMLGSRRDTENSPRGTNLQDPTLNQKETTSTSFASSKEDIDPLPFSTSADNETN
ncbi:MAG: single-stranded DNA-binding protein [Flavobacteriales bacterium]|nr:single-stranded DNA-binding protein [Flavobacteriales bacterium]|tara:strand:- start:2586 stop:3062 length:477 start_codon:yes stop_codon:yes gene_type:complete